MKIEKTITLLAGWILCALLALPAGIYAQSPGETVNQEGTVYQKDLGKNTDGNAGAIRKYDPDGRWKKVEQAAPDLAAFAPEVRPCSDELARFCKDIKPGGGRIVSCLKQHEGELTSICRDKLQDLQKKIDEFRQVCATDIDNLCKGVEPGEGRILKCLDGNSDRLTPGCAGMINLVRSKLRGK